MRWLSILILILAGHVTAPQSAAADDRLEVVAFLTVECPLAGLYSHRLNELAARYSERGVRFVALDPKLRDRDDQIAEFAGRLSFPFTRDEEQARTTEYGITRSPEVLLLDHGNVIYRGRVDDQYAPGVYGRTAPTRRDLEEAIIESLAGRTISVPETEPAGCFIERYAGAASDGPVTYYGQAAAIFAARCVECHTAGEAAPFALTTYDDAVAWAATIDEVIRERRMPPWGARGHFANDRSLSDEERATILAWLESGTPAGVPVKQPVPAADSECLDADMVLTAPEFAVPAEGVLDYREAIIDPGFQRDTWIQAVEIRPGERRVVHHVNVYLKPKGARSNQLFLNDLGDYYLCMAVPGNYVTRFPAGTAKMIPAGWNIVLEIHYVPNGTPCHDQTAIALENADPATVRRKLASRVIIDEDICIPPHQRQGVSRSWTLDDDYTLFALYPHMHLRGRSMQFEARYPSGDRETLLDVYDYDFAWQYRYVLSEPKELPRGTVITCTAVYDNTAANPHNPDPNATVRAGRQTTDEMFQAGLEICRTHEDRLGGRGWLLPLALLSLAAVLIFWRRINQPAVARPTESADA